MQLPYSPIRNTKVPYISFAAGFLAHRLHIGPSHFIVNSCAIRSHSFFTPEHLHLANCPFASATLITSTSEIPFIGKCGSISKCSCKRIIILLKMGFTFSFPPDKKAINIKVCNGHIIIFKCFPQKL